MQSETQQQRYLFNVSNLDIILFIIDFEQFMKSFLV